MSAQIHPLPVVTEQFERERAAQAEARHIVLQWLQAIEMARRAGEELALLGFVESMDMTLAATKLECNPPVEALRRLISWRDPS
ncbi:MULTISPECIES: hypothetical protein [unclassified Neorhizobium]|uniref:hypothetical protein n=1 Tax=unclassified Neorhizobium TaxID=2629175 RepID=UPI001FF13C82|nr:MULTISPECIES: hypothetical protein [unclassified Neorhizobium]MCJ9668988.1 hypothetical protein [Neorhizobium sp. SHOUNA12B]MCJ9744942.1 hypothetical protein [Neorhizobium sp. SHOUNA12A]